MGTLYRYYAALRPPFIGTYPRGSVQSHVFPDGPRIVEGVGSGGLATWKYHGWVEYDRPLTDEEVYRYDLVPFSGDSR